MTSKPRGGYRPGAGRKPCYALLWGLDAAALASITAAPARAARRWLAGTADMGAVRLACLLDARPDIDARELVVELARRQRLPTGPPRAPAL